MWEEAIICSPSHIQLVGLSATMSNAQDLANWISRVHHPISLIVHEATCGPAGTLLLSRWSPPCTGCGWQSYRSASRISEAKRSLAPDDVAIATIHFNEDEEDTDDLDADEWEPQHKKGKYSHHPSQARQARCDRNHKSKPRRQAMQLSRKAKSPNVQNQGKRQNRAKYSLSYERPICYPVSIFCQDGASSKRLLWAQHATVSPRQQRKP